VTTAPGVVELAIVRNAAKPNTRRETVGVDPLVTADATTLAAVLALQCLFVSFDFVVRDDGHDFAASFGFQGDEVGRVASKEKFVTRIEESPFDVDLADSRIDRTGLLIVYFQSVAPISS
jgi:hypothetical protein